MKSNRNMVLNRVPPFGIYKRKYFSLKGFFSCENVNVRLRIFLTLFISYVGFSYLCTFLFKKFNRINRYSVLAHFKVEIASFYGKILGRLADITENMSRFHIIADAETA